MELVDFIIMAKLAGYATGGEGKEIHFADGSKGFEYSDGNYRYIDRYYGSNPFSGFEQVYDSSANLIWSMNYYGRVSKSCAEPKEIYHILRAAM